VPGALPFAQAADFEDFGRVVRVTPQVEQINRPRQECRTEYVQVQQPRRSAAWAAPSSAASSAAWPVTRSAAARAARWPRPPAPSPARWSATASTTPNPYQGGVQEQAVKQCRTVDHWESRTSGYEVTYDYRGRNYTSIMSYDPGERVRLRVVVEPMQR
jgi:uncharacterized protein YcfJ